MQIFTNDQLIQAAFNTYEVYNKLVDAIWGAIFIDLTKYFGEFTDSLIKSDVSGIFVSSFMFISLSVFAYRIFKKKPLSFLGHIFNDIF